MPLTHSLKQSRTAYAIDWLQIACTSMDEYGDVIKLPSEMTSPNRDASGNHRFYELIEPKEFTHGYLQHKSVVWRGLIVAHVSCQPRNEHVSRFRASLKMANATLYCGDWFFLLNDICAALYWTPEKITRCDLCADFNFFLGGLCPATFMRKYVCKNNASYIRVGSNDFAVYGSKTNTATSFNSIRWGSRQNGVSVYMYNKSKELAEKKNKPWIKNHWKNHDLSSTKDVWRVEISINSEGCGLKSISSGLLHTLFIEDIATPDMARRIFQTYASKYFRFKRTSPNIKHRKDLPDIPLLNLDEVLDLRPCTLSESSDSGRKEWSVIQSLNAVREALHFIDSPFKTKENLEAVERCTTLYEDMFATKQQESNRYKEAKERMILRASALLDSKLREEKKVSSINAQYFSQDVLRQVVADSVRKLPLLHP